MQLQILLFECLSWTLTLTSQLRKLKTHMTFDSQKCCLAIFAVWQMSSLTLYPGPTALFRLAPYYNAAVQEAETISISVLAYSSLINISLTHLPVSPDDITMVICPGIGNHSEKHYIRTFVDYAQKDGYRCAVLNHLGALPNIELTSPRMFTYGETKNLILSPRWGHLLCISSEWKFKSVVHQYSRLQLSGVAAGWESVLQQLLAGALLKYSERFKTMSLVKPWLYLNVT